MKRLIRIVVAAILASTLLAGGEAAAQGRNHGDDHDRGRGWAAAPRGERGDHGDRGYRGGERIYPGGRDSRRPPGVPVERGVAPGGRWDGGPPAGRWDGGPPQAYGYPGPPSYERRLPPPGYGLRRGGLVPPQFRGAIVPDYGRHRLRPPPPGFAWVRMGDRYMLVSRSTGQIFDVIGN